MKTINCFIDSTYVLICRKRYFDWYCLCNVFSAASFQSWKHSCLSVGIVIYHRRVLYWFEIPDCTSLIPCYNRVNWNYIKIRNRSSAKTYHGLSEVYRCAMHTIAEYWKKNVHFRKTTDNWPYIDAKNCATRWEDAFLWW